MKFKWGGFLLVIIFVFALRGVSYSKESEIVRNFRAAYEEKDYDGMTSIVEDNKAKIPAEIDSLLEDALSVNTGKAERETEFTVAEFMAEEYKNLTGNIGFLKNVKKRVFESRLHPPVLSKPVNGVDFVAALSTQKEKNIFVPDNIIIKRGETLKWENKDDVTHLLASMPVIGSTGIFSPRIEPGQSWEFKFEEPGDYYYICFIHKKMYGKVTVE